MRCEGTSFPYWVRNDRYGVLESIGAIPGRAIEVVCTSCNTIRTCERIPEDNPLSNRVEAVCRTCRGKLC